MNEYRLTVVWTDGVQGVWSSWWSSWLSKGSSSWWCHPRGAWASQWLLCHPDDSLEGLPVDRWASLAPNWDAIHQDAPGDFSAEGYQRFFYSGGSPWEILGSMSSSKVESAKLMNHVGGVGWGTECTWSTAVGSAHSLVDHLCQV